MIEYLIDKEIQNYIFNSSTNINKNLLLTKLLFLVEM